MFGIHDWRLESHVDCSHLQAKRVTWFDMFKETHDAACCKVLQVEMYTAGVTLSEHTFLRKWLMMMLDKPTHV